MKFTIIKKQERISAFTKIDKKDITYIKQGYLSVKDLRNSKYSKSLSQIPQQSQIELNTTGKTIFTVVTTTVVSINKKATL